MTAILISTFERYALLAHWTAKRLHASWKEHPPLFFSGLNRQGACYLGCSGDAADWISVTLEAVEKLRIRGFTHAYLILEDHPPMGKCHEVFLNKHLPALAVTLEAVCINLLGYGQHRPANGILLPKKEGFLERCSSEDPWKFSLHPGLWNLEAFAQLLKQRKNAYEEKERTPWNFEMHDDRFVDLAIKPLLERCFRVSGEHFLRQQGKMKLQLFASKIDRLLGDGRLFFKEKTAGEEARYALEKKLSWLYGHYLGPYPLFWGGIMERGRLSESWKRWLSHAGDQDLQMAWALLNQNKKDFLSLEKDKK